MPKTILLIEDYEDTRRAYKALLERHGFVVLDAGSGSAARRIFAEHRIDLIVSDVGLPDCYGYELLQEFRAIRETPAIAVSGVGHSDDVAKCFEAGFLEHIIKPASPKQLLALIRSLLDVEAEKATAEAISKVEVAKPVVPEIPTPTVHPSVLDMTTEPIPNLIPSSAETAEPGAFPGAPESPAKTESQKMEAASPDTVAASGESSAPPATTV